MPSGNIIDNIIISNIKNNTFFGHDGEIWIDVVLQSTSSPLKAIDEDNIIIKYNDKLGNTTTTVRRINYPNFDANESIKEYDLNGSGVEGAPGIIKSITFKHNKVLYSFQGHIPYGNQKMIDIFNKIIMSIKFIESEKFVDIDSEDKIIDSFKTNNDNNKKFIFTGKDKNNWNIYRSDDYGFEIKYPDFLNVVGDQNTIITNIQGDPPTFLAQDGDIWISVNEVESDKIAVFNKIGKIEKDYSDKLGNTIKRYYKADFLSFEAAISELEYSGGEILGNAGLYKTLYFKNKNNKVNVISAHTPYKNEKQIDLFDKILKTIKLVN